MPAPLDRPSSSCKNETRHLSEVTTVYNMVDLPLQAIHMVTSHVARHVSGGYGCFGLHDKATRQTWHAK